METFQIKNLTFTYPNELSPAVSDVTLSVEKGDFLVLCGHSGCGKSTLLRQLKPSVAPYGKREGKIVFCGTPIKDISDKESASRIGFVWQDPESHIVTDKVWHELAFGLENLGEDRRAIRHRCAETASFFGMEDWYYKDVSTLSGGQKQLLCLASVMTMRPDVLILDEPTAQLDPIAAATFLSAVHKINREIGTTVILSEHRLEESIPMANKIAVMEHGTVLCCGDAEHIGSWLKEQNSPLFSLMPTAMRVWASVKTDLPCPITVNEGRHFLNAYLETHEKHPLPADTRGNRHMAEKIKVIDACFRYEKNAPDVVKNLNFSAYGKELFCILGGNGTGKTTALKLIAGIQKAQSGSVCVTGNVGYLPQDPKTVFTQKTVAEDLSQTLTAKGTDAEKKRQEIRRVSELCQIEALFYRHPYDLSGGEQQRVALAKILLSAPDVLLLDEPTKGMDGPFKNTLAGILQRLKDSGVCVVMVSHDVEFCAKYADRCGLFFDGNLVSVSSPRDFFSDNRFYTTAANRMARGIQENAVTVADVTALIGGRADEPSPMPSDESTSSFTEENPRQDKEKPLPLWRKIGAALFGSSAVAFLIYVAKTNRLSEMVSANGITASGKNQLILYGIFIALVIITTIFVSRKSTRIPAPVEKQKSSKRTIVASVFILLLIPLSLYIGVFYLDRKQYYITALAILAECMTPFFLIFEGRKPKARELVTIATLCALAIAGRAAFFMVPQFKPVMALTIIAGVAFGGETGFFVGAVTMLVSNMLFSQGPWTPWQMFAMGIIGFLAGILFRKGLLRRTRASLCLFGIICTFFIYGGINNPSSALIWNHESLNVTMLMSYYVTGFPMDVVHAIATAVFLWFGAEPMLEKLDRLKVKYGLLSSSATKKSMDFTADV